MKHFPSMTRKERISKCIAHQGQPPHRKLIIQVRKLFIKNIFFREFVPEQNFLNEGNDFLYFQVKRHDAEEVLYKFKTETLTLKSSHILNLTRLLTAIL